jgi:hypothetical protein
MTVAALSFDPIIFSITIGLAGVVAFCRLILGWALAT